MRAGAVLAGVVIWMGIGIGCGERGESPRTTVAEAEPVVDDDTLVDDEAVPSRDFTWIVARFRRNQLSECSEIAASVVALPDPLPDVWPPDVPESMLEGAVTVRRPCVEAFADRTVLASCDVPWTLRENTAYGPARVTARSYWYDSAVLESDAQMRECLEMDGDWTAIGRESPEAARIRSRSRAQELLDMSRRAGGR